MLLLALALPLFQQLDDGLLHPLGRVAPGEIFAQGVAGEGDLVQVAFLFFTFTSDTLRKYFPRSYTPARMQETIIKLLEAWQRKRQRDQER